jgi:ubiquinone/menaquinone biosynthesis C-methylase UbiE
VIDYDKIAAEYAQHRKVHPEVLKHLYRDSGITKDSVVLEVGCGTGNYILALEKLSGADCWGTDPSGLMLEQARLRTEKITFQRGQAEQLDFPEVFDFVFSVDVVHHLKDPLAYFKEAHRVLVRGGTLCTVTDSEEIIRTREPLAIYFPETIKADLKRYYPIAELREELEAAGFGKLSETTVEFSYQLTDIQAYRDKAFSCLHLIPKDAFKRGIKEMEHDLEAGPIKCTPRYLLLWGTNS